MMRKIVLMLFCMMALCAHAQQAVTKTSHRKAVKEDLVTTGTMTMRKPDYICISTDGDKDQLIMEGTKFTMTLGGKQHTTDSKKNQQFATFHQVLKALINGQPIPAGDDLTVSTKGGQTVITITPAGKKRRLFTSFVLTVDSKTKAFKTLRMNGRKDDYTEYTFK